MKQFPARTLLQLRAHSRGLPEGKILVCNPLEFIVRCGNLEDANDMAAKFKNAADVVIGYGEPTQVLFKPKE